MTSQCPCGRDTLDEVKVAEAVHTAAASLAGGGGGMAGSRGRHMTCNNSQLTKCTNLPHRPPQLRCEQSASTMRRRAATPTRRWVELQEDDKGRTVDMTIVRPFTPQHRPGCSHQALCQGVSGCLRRPVDTRQCTVHVNNPCCHHSNYCEPKPPTCHPSRRPISAAGDCFTRQAVNPTCHPSRRPLTAFNTLPRSNTSLMTSCGCCCHNVAPDVIVPATTTATTRVTSLRDGDVRRRPNLMADTTPPPSIASCEAARNALLAIYQAGKPDEMFHVRAPPTSLIQSMLTAVTMETRDRNMAVADAMRKHESSVGGVARPGMRMPANGSSSVACLPLHPAQHQRHHLVNHCPTCRPSCVTGGAQSAAGTCCQAASTCCCHDNGPVPDVISDVTARPVNVNVECPANTDTVVNLRVQSQPFQLRAY